MVNDETKVEVLRERVVNKSSLDASDSLFLIGVIDKMKNLLDEGDLMDAFGTEGWRHTIGWED